MFQKSKQFISIFALCLFFLFSAFALQAAEKNLPLGARCQAPHECTRFYDGFTELGCRKSNLGNYKICKIVTQGISGCRQSPQGENWCGDEMVCRDDDICRYPYPQPGEIDIPTPSSEAALTLLFKIINLLLAVALIIGLIILLKGFMTWRTAVGHEPLNHKAYKLMIIGGGIIAAALIISWILSRLALG